MNVETYRPTGMLLPAVISVLNWMALRGPLVGNVIRRRLGSGALDAFVVGTLVALAIANSLPSPLGLWALILPAACAYLLFGMLVAGLRVIFSATSDAFAVDDPRRTFLLTLINVFAVIYLFAVSDRWLAHAWPQLVEFKDSGNGRVAGQTDFLYMSWTNLTTLGSNFVPSNIGAQAMNLAEVTSGLLLLTVIVAVVLGSIRPILRQ